MVAAVVGMVARVVEVAAGREEAGGSGYARVAAEAVPMVGLGWLRRLLGGVGARQGIREGGEVEVGAAGHDIGVVVDVELVAAGAGGEVPVVELGGCSCGPAVEEKEKEDRPLFEEAGGC